MSRLTPGRHLIGEIGVDSGQMMLIDPCYIDDYWTHSEFVMGSYDATLPGSLDYDSACKVTLAHTAGPLANERGIVLAAVTSTGYGDGVYPVWVDVNEEGRVSRMTIDFFGDFDAE